MKKVNVLFFIYQMGGGGAARTLLNIINNLDRSTFRPVLVTLNFDGAYEQELAEDVQFIKLESKRLRGAIFPLAKIIRQENIDIVFSTIPNVNTIAILANRLSFTQAKNVIREADNLGGNWKADLKLRCFGLVYKLSQHIISLSEGVKENLAQRYKINPEHVQVIYNPVDVEHISHKLEQETMDPAHQSLFEGEEKVIITAGRLVEQKDHRTLLKAFARIQDQVKSRLVMLGEGPLEEELKELAAQLQLEERVHFIGFQSNPYIYFQQADLFVLSSKHEGFSHVIAEALATGTPVVSTNCRSGPSEVLQQGKYGWLCAVGDDKEMAEKMTEALTLKEQKLSEVIKGGVKRAHDFEAPKIVRQYEQAFLDTLDKKES